MSGGGVSYLWAVCSLQRDGVDPLRVGWVCETVIGQRHEAAWRVTQSWRHGRICTVVVRVQVGARAAEAERVYWCQDAWSAVPHHDIDGSPQAVLVREAEALACAAYGQDSLSTCGVPLLPQRQEPTHE